MKLTSLLKPSLIFFDTPGEDREQVYEALFRAAGKVVRLPMTPSEATKSVIAREENIGIAYEKGFAFPHSRDTRWKDLSLIVGIPKVPVKLTPRDSSPNRLIVTSFVSETTSGLYLMALAAFSRYLLKPGKLEGLVAAGSPKRVLEILDADNVEVKHALTAEDVMDRDFPRVKEDDPLSAALDLFTRKGLTALPVVDADGALKGVVSAETIVKRYIPNCIIMLDNLKFLTSFEPFEELFKHEDVHLVRDCMSPPRATIAPGTPLVQLTVSLIKGEAAYLFVIENNKLAGVITMLEIIRRVVRG